MIVYKLTDRDMQTYNGFQWNLNQTHTARGAGPLCSAGWLHVYESPLLAILHNPIHAGIQRPRLFRGEAQRPIRREGAMKIGVAKLTLVAELPVPVVTSEQSVRYAIRCARAVWRRPDFVRWSNQWLTGEDRSIKAVETPWTETWAEAGGKAWSAVWAAAWAAKTAAIAASAESTAVAAASTARTAAIAKVGLPLAAFAEWAMTDRVEW